jgi:hypothetical protein
MVFAFIPSVVLAADAVSGVDPSPVSLSLPPLEGRHPKSF